MADPVLLTRLQALEHDLNQMEDPWKWRDIFKRKFPIRQEVWNAVSNQIRSAVRVQLADIRDARDMLAEADKQDEETRKQTLVTVWKKYANIFKASEEVFSECHEFVGGLIFREKELDDSICEIADELIHSCATIASKVPTITVPTARESLRKTLGRIVRLRYPDWSIWTLPMVAHEYGHVVDDETPPLKEFIKQVAAEWVAQDKPDDRDAEALMNRHVSHIEEFMADTFAVYTMGPAYAFAAMELRLNPANLASETGDLPGDVKRAYVVRRMLELMNGSESGNSWHPYTNVITYLKGNWDDASRRAWTKGPLADADLSRLENVTLRLWDIFNKAISGPLYPSMYSPDRDGWMVVIQWSDVWQKQLERGLPLTPLEDVTHSSKLRDALNVAWHCRMHYPKQSD